METKLFEVRDSSTLIPTIAIKVTVGNKGENFLIRRAGYSTERDYVLFGDINGGSKLEYDVFAWGNRTRHEAHKFILKHFDALESGDVIDVQYILKETPTKKLTEG